MTTQSLFDNSEIVFYDANSTQLAQISCTGSLLFDASSIGNVSLGFGSISNLNCSNIQSSNLNSIYITSSYLQFTSSLSSSNYNSTGTISTTLSATCTNLIANSAIISKSTITNLNTTNSTHNALNSTSMTSTNLIINNNLNIVQNTISSGTGLFNTISATNPVYGYATAHGSSQTITSGSFQILNGTNYWTATSLFGNLTFTNGTFTLPETGYYAVTYNVSIYKTNGTGSRAAQIVLNGDTTKYYGFVQVPASSTDDVIICSQIVRKFSAGDTLALYVFQNSGSPIGMDNGPRSWFTLAKIF